MIAHSCRKSAAIAVHEESELDYPKGFPSIQFPEDNAYSAARWKLGKKLFYDKALSIDSTVSCASCHLPSNSFADPRKVSIGVQGKLGTRNSPSLANIGYHPYFTREGGVPSLEMQVLVPIQEHNEFGFNILAIGERLRKNKEYTQLSQDAYAKDIDYNTLVRALSTFERSLITGNSPYDKFVYHKQNQALSASAKKGMALFFSAKTNCSKCHSGFNFTDYAFQNNGLYAKYSDPGRQRLTKVASDIGKFKVPSLRNVEVTAPYMHDGSVNTLDEVIEHYSKGGMNHKNQSTIIQPLNLSSEEKQDLKAFLLSLTDHEFLNNKKYQP